VFLKCRLRIGPAEHCVKVVSYGEAAGVSLAPGCGPVQLIYLLVRPGDEHSYAVSPLIDGLLNKVRLDANRFLDHVEELLRRAEEAACCEGVGCEP